MHFDANSMIPLYSQIATQFTDGILSGSFPEGTQIPSTTEVSKNYAINPATVLRGMNELVSAGLIEKRRGVGMFVTAGAQSKIQKTRKTQFYKSNVTELLNAAKALNISRDELIRVIKEEYTNE